MNLTDCQPSLFIEAEIEAEQKAVKKPSKNKENNRLDGVCDPHSYDYILIAMSGGKDSKACMLHLLEMGVDRSKLELWHQEVDGREGSTMFDWPVTRAYNEALAKAFDLPLYFSWRTGGIEREMLRENARTAPTKFETPEGLQEAGGIRGKESVRRRFPQQSADLSTRWCSSSAKIDVCTIAINNQERFIGKRVLLVTGERAEESKARSGYNTYELHKSNTKKRTVHQWRPVHAWSEKEVWAILERWKVNPHPAYHLGWGRMSCMICIFGSPNQWASINAIEPKKIIQIAKYEESFNSTLRRDGGIMKTVAKGVPYNMKPEDIRIAMSHTYDQPIFVQDWKLPAGAFAESNGPT